MVIDPAQSQLESLIGRPLDKRKVVVPGLSSLPCGDTSMSDDERKTYVGIIIREDNGLVRISHCLFLPALAPTAFSMLQLVENVFWAESSLGVYRSMIRPEANERVHHVKIVRDWI